jgi:hypothetical protein
MIIIPTVWMDVLKVSMKVNGNKSVRLQVFSSVIKTGQEKLFNLLEYIFHTKNSNFTFCFLQSGRFVAYETNKLKLLE